MNSEMMKSLVNKIIKVDRGGPESRVGKLLGVQDDFFVLYTKEDGVVYYRMQHVKSITLNTKGEHKFDVEVPEQLTLLEETLFEPMLEGLRHQWIKINRGGPEKIEGVIDNITKDYVTVISNEEILHLAMYHIRNISVGVGEAKEETKDNKNEKKQRNNFGTV